MKISVSCTRELDFQGSTGYVSVCFFLFLGVWFLDGFGNGILVISGWILEALLHPKSIKSVLDFWIYLYMGVQRMPERALVSHGLPRLSIWGGDALAGCPDTAREA